MKFISLFFVSFFILEISCGGGNAHICWFYQTYFDQSLETYKTMTAKWAQHLVNLMEAYSEKNPALRDQALDEVLNGLIAKEQTMFETYFQNLVKEIAGLTSIDEEVVAESLKSASFGAPFPLSCIENLSEAGKVRKGLQKDINSEKKAIEHHTKSRQVYF